MLSFAQKKKEQIYASTKSRIKQYFQENTENSIVSNKTFWNFIKPFLINKRSSSQNDIVFIGNGKNIFGENALVEIFRNHYVKIVEKPFKIKPFASLSKATDYENFVN